MSTLGGGRGGRAARAAARAAVLRCAVAAGLLFADVCLFRGLLVGLLADMSLLVGLLADLAARLLADVGRMKVT